MSRRSRARPTRTHLATGLLAWALPALSAQGLACSVAPTRPTTFAAASISPTPRVKASSLSPAATRRFELSSNEDFVVRIVAPGTSCSGTLISEQTVLTAHHCVALRNGQGHILPADADPKRLVVEVGSGHFPWAEVPVRAIVAPTCGFAAGEGDLALLILARRLRGAKVLAPNLDAGPARGNRVTYLGFGRCALSEDGIYLKRRPASLVDRVGRTYFRATGPLCPGDSGGPVLDQRTGAFIGVISAGAMDGDEQTPDRIEFSRLEPFRSLFANAERLLQGSPASELPPVDCPAPEPLPVQSGAK